LLAESLQASPTPDPPPGSFSSVAAYEPGSGQSCNTTGAIMLTRCFRSNPGRVQTRSAAMRNRKHPKDQHVQGWSSGSAIPRARAFFRRSVTMPMTPVSGPRRTSTLWPTSTQGHGAIRTWAFTARLIAEISASDIGTGEFPARITSTIPGVLRMGKIANRSEGRIHNQKKAVIQRGPLVCPTF
jgi:hypothetical protein